MSEKPKNNDNLSYWEGKIDDAQIVIILQHNETTFLYSEEVNLSAKEQEKILKSVILQCLDEIFRYRNAVT